MIRTDSTIGSVEETPYTVVAMGALVQFSYLQLLDLLTTVAFMVTGVKEANPFVVAMMKHADNPLIGLLLVKLLAVALGWYCWKRGRMGILTKANMFFAVLVAWNLVALVMAAAQTA